MLERKSGGKRHASVQPGLVILQKRKSAPSPSCCLKKDRTSGKIPRMPATAVESPWRGVAHTLQSRECPYTSRRSIDTMSLEGFITRNIHSDNSVVLVCCRWRMLRQPCAMGWHTVLQVTRFPPERHLSHARKNSSWPPQACVVLCRHAKD